jgi:diguanylate cyclase (GGDEF)-like protein/PAS domain S-box-containing protein
MAALLKTKRLGWAITFLLVTLMALLSYVSGKRYLAAVHAVEHTLAVESALHNTLTLLVDAETGHRGFLLTDNPLFLEPLQWAQRDVPGSLARLDELLAGDSSQLAHLAEMQRLIQLKLEFIDSSDRQLQGGDRAAAIERVRTGRGKQLMDGIRAQCRAMLEHEEQLLAERKRQAESAEHRAAWGIGAGTSLMVLLALFSLVTVNRDVDELRQASEELAKSEEHYRLLTEHGSDLVRLLGLDGKVRYVSPSVERLLGYSVDEYMALTPLSIMHPSELELGQKMLQDVQSGRLGGGVSTYRLLDKKGEYRWFEVRWAVIRDRDGKPRELHTAARDVTERRDAEQQLNSYAKQLRSLSIRDELTGLYNRRGFLEVAGQAHTQALRDARPAALIFIDLNGMKRINDELGHDIGDQALVDTADVLSAALRESDVIGRLGGDEFVVFALDVTLEHVDRLRRRLRELADKRVSEGARPFRLSMSVGAAFVDSSKPATLEELLELADASMYEQKKARQAAGGVSIPPPASREG